MPVKDREVIINLDENIRIVYLRSSVRPVEYAVLLQKQELKGPKTVIVADNSHEGRRIGDGIDEHHCHRYVDDEKQPAEPLPFSVTDANDAMAKVIRWFTSDWKELVS
jgi:hypothetical protein